MFNLRTLAPKCIRTQALTLHSHPPSSRFFHEGSRFFARIPLSIPRSLPSIPRRQFMTAPSLRSRLNQLLSEGFKDFFPKNAPKKNGNRPKTEPGPPPPSNQDPNNMGQWLSVLATTAIMLFGLYHISGSVAGNPGREITFQEFLTLYLDPGRVSSLEVASSKDRVYVFLRKPGAELTQTVTTDGQDNSQKSQQLHTPAGYFTIGSVEAFERQLHDAQRDLDPADTVPVKYLRESEMVSLIKALAPIALTLIPLYLIYKSFSANIGGMTGAGGKGSRNIFSIGKSPATVIRPGEKTSVTFSDVAGLDEAKVEITEFVEFLKAPDKFKALGAKIPKGALLVGPPGTGKTLLAKATAGEANVPFYSVSGSDFIEMFVGIGPSRVRDLFARARADSPCIIWIDEIDAVGRSRSKGGFGGGHDERESTLNQLLVEMDGFQTNDSVVVLAGTNRKDILDKALLRPGRFDRMVNITLPDIKGRQQIFKVHLGKIKLGHPLDDVAQRLSALTPGFSGADIANICNEAAILAARKDHKTVELKDFEAAVDRVIGGLEKKNSAMTVSEKKLVAYHESGHAVAGWFLEHADPLLKVTVVPRANGALGFAQYLPKELYLYQTDQLRDMMVMTLAGRAAEQVFFGKISTGAADDLKKLTNLAQAQVCKFGMSKRLGHVAYDQDEERFTKPFSDATSRIIDEEVSLMISETYDRAIKLIEEKKALVEKLALKLLEVETVNHDLLVEVLGERPYQSESYKQYVMHAIDKPMPKPTDGSKNNKENEAEEAPSILSPSPA